MPLNELPREILLEGPQPPNPWLITLIRSKLAEIPQPGEANGHSHSHNGSSETDIDSETESEWLQGRRRENRLTTPSSQSSICKLAEIGQFIVHSATVTSKLASALANGEHIGVYIDSHIRELSKTHQMSEMDMIEYMSRKENILKTIAAQLEEMTNNINLLWDQGPDPPGHVDSLTSAVATATVNESEGNTSPHPISKIEFVRKFSPSSSPSSSSSYNIQPSDHSDLSRPPSSGPPIEDLQNYYNQLSGRGKGQYECPFKHRCNKGGVRGAELVVFKRNSAFKAHLQKHERAYKCDILGCKNRAGFSRTDQLKRHKKEVHRIGLKRDQIESKGTPISTNS